MIHIPTEDVINNNMNRHKRGINKNAMIHSNTKKTYQTHGNTQMKLYDNLLIKRKQIKLMEVLT